MKSFATRNQLFGSVLKRNRIKIGLSQKELVDVLNKMNPWLNMSYPSYSRFESGEASMSAVQFEAFCRWLEEQTQSSPVAHEIFFEFRQLIDQIEDKGFQVVARTDSKSVDVVDYKTLTETVRGIFPSIGDSPIKQTLAATVMLLAGGLPALMIKKSLANPVNDNSSQEGGDDVKK